MNTELKTALEILEKEKDISKDVMLDAIENSLITACQSHFGKEKENFRVEINRDTCDFHVYAEKTVVEQVEDPDTQISLAEAKLLDKKYELGDIVREEIKSKEFGRITTQNARNVILQKIREEERWEKLQPLQCAVLIIDLQQVIRRKDIGQIGMTKLAEIFWMDRR